MRLAGGSVGDCRHRSNRHRRRGVASDRLEQNRLRLRAAFEQLLGDQEAMTLVAHHERRADVGTPASRASVSCSIVPLPTSGSSCFG